jgi:hypothetical protein
MLILKTAHILLVSLIVPIMSILPGTLFLWMFSSLRGEELIAAGLGLSLLLFGTSSFVAFFIGPCGWIFNLATFLLSVLILELLAIRTRRADRDVGVCLQIPRFSAFLFFAYYFHLLFFQAVLPVYASNGWYGDWWAHYERARIYLCGAPLTTFWSGDNAVYSRTPLFNLAASYFLSFLGDSFWAFQIVSSFLNSLLVLGLYLIVKMIFNERVALVGFLLVLFNPYLMRNALYTWPKPFTAYLVFLSFHFYLRFREASASPSSEWKCAGFLSGLFMGMAYMSHIYAAFYMMVPVVDYLLFLRRAGGFRLTRLRRFVALYFLPLVPILLPWHLWVVATFGPKTVLEYWLFFNSRGMGFYPTLKIMGNNLVCTVLPLNLILALKAHGFQLRSLYSNWLLTEFSLSGALTFSIATFLIIYIARSFLADAHTFWKTRFSMMNDKVMKSAHLLMGMTIVGGCIWCVLGGRAVISASGALTAAGIPIVATLLTYAARALCNTKPKWRALIFSGVFVEFVLAIWLQTYFVISGVGWKTDKNWILKARHGLMFLHDYIGNLWTFSALLAIALECLIALGVSKELSSLRGVEVAKAAKLAKA